jgi:hypothetical protein
MWSMLGPGDQGGPRAQRGAADQASGRRGLLWPLGPTTSAGRLAHYIGGVAGLDVFRLTQYARGGGCACKIPPGELEETVS